MRPEELLQLLPEWLKDFSYKRYLSDNYVVIDFETTILDKGSPYVPENSIVCSSYKLGKNHPRYDGNRAVVIKGNEYQQQELIKVIEEADFWVAHNTKFEYGWLERCGLPLEATLAFCTLLAEYVLLSNRLGKRLSRLSLDNCLKVRGFPQKAQLGKKLLTAGVCPSTWPDKWLIPYSKQDVVATEILFLQQRKVLIAKDQLKTVFTRNIFTPPIVNIEQNGMHLDKQRVLKVTADYNREISYVLAELDKITGGANPRSVPQMRKVLYEDLKFKKPTDKNWLTDSGEPTTKFDYINTLKPKNKKQTRFKELKQEYSKLNAALTKALTKFSNCVNETEDSILTATFNQAVTATQRLSSTGKNYKAQLQNLFRIFKPLFSARNEGWEIGEIDQGQLEYRVAVFLGNDEAGLNDIKDGVDAHSFTAEHIFGGDFTELAPESEQRYALRTAAKSRTFKPLYGGQSGTKEEVAYYQAFKEKHQGITRVQNEWKMSAVNTGKVSIPSGAIFYFPGTKIMNDGYVTNSTNICNYPVQSLASADIVPIGVVYQWHIMRVAKLKSFLINTVHDSSIGEVHPEEKDIYREIGEYTFTTVVYKYLKEVYGIDFFVPLEAEVSYNKNWSDSEDWRKKYLQ